MKLLVPIVIILLLIGAMFLLQQKKAIRIESLSKTDNNVESMGNDRVFVTNVDPDVSHWQTKETEFFTIKFPKEWYWLESDLKKTGYYSQVITNNPNFDINKYADISLGTGGSYHVTSQDGTTTSIPLQDDEVIISFGGTATANSGTPEQSIDSVFQSKQGNPYPVHCQRLSNPNIVPIRAHCSFIDNATVTTPQKIQTYYIVNELNNISVSARTTDTTTVPKDILDKIAENMVVKETW